MSTIQEHTGAVLALLRADSRLTVFPAPETGDGAEPATKLVPDGTAPPYCAVHFHREFGDAEDLTGATSRVVLRAIVHCVGANDIAARAVAGLVEDALLDVEPSIPDRTVFPIRHEGSVPPREDESTGARVVDLTETYRLESVPA